MSQEKRGFKFALSKIESLLKVVKAIIPIGNPDWEKILNKHASCYPTKDCTAKLLKLKAQVPGAWAHKNSYGGLKHASSHSQGQAYLL
jgi:hypothetical protein